jgi:hypothetical protein
MTYLDVSPMITALQRDPSDFGMQRGWLHHYPSRHAFKFDRDGKVRLHAYCDCAMLSIRQEQSLELWDAYRQWYASYWRPVEINKEFAAHFREPNAVVRLLRRASANIRRRWLHRAETETAVETMVPAE